MKINMSINRRSIDDLMMETRTLSLSEWNYIVGTLAGRGLSLDEMIEYLEKNMKCVTYTRKKTVAFIRDFARVYPDTSIRGIEKYIDHVRHIRAVSRDTTYSVSHSSGRPSFASGVELIEYFFSHTEPVLPMFDIPSDIEKAAMYYYDLGFTPFPKRSDEKHPMVRYAHLRNVRYPRTHILDRYIWSGGICLLGDEEHCYLDLDVHDGRENGVALLDRKLLSGRHYEKTKNGGYHIFGLGKCPSISPIHGVELKGETNLIVVYPSSGYQVYP